MISPLHYGTFKLAAVLTALGIVVVTINPTVTVAMIMSIPGTAAAILGFMQRRDANRYAREQREDTNRLREEQTALHATTAAIAKSVDGMNTALRTKADEQAVQLIDTSKQLAHQQGVKEGSDSEREKDK
jgi:hypothetical protein